MHTDINLSLPLPKHWLVKRVLFPAMISCQFVILLPGPIKFHRVWVYWLHSEVYVVIEISLDGQGYGQGIRRARQALWCWHGSHVRVPEALSKKNQSWLFAAANECNETLLRDASSDVIVSRPVPIPPIHPPGAPQCQKFFPMQWRQGREAWG